MANANTINFQPEVKAKDELKALAKAAQVTEAKPHHFDVEPKIVGDDRATQPEWLGDPSPQAGDTFTPLKGKKGVYHALQVAPDKVAPLVRIVTH